MTIIGAFEHSFELEEALAELEHNGICRRHILAIPMNTYFGNSEKKISESHDFNSRGIEIGIACATASSVIGTSAGFILHWGPIIWGLGAALIGFTIGFGLYFYFNKDNRRNVLKSIPEVVVLIQCPEKCSDLVMRIMWKYSVLTIGQISDSL